MIRSDDCQTTMALCTYDRSAHSQMRRGGGWPALWLTGRNGSRSEAAVTAARSQSHHHQKTTLTENVIGGCKSRGH